MIQEYFRNCCTEEELQKEHRRLVIKMHPDRNPDDPDATAKFQEMQAQYEERLAELHGDYRAGAKGRERRARAEREQREREERERREREARKVEEVINQARRNKGVSFDKIKEGDYIYARRIADDNQSGFDWNELQGKQIVNIAWRFTPCAETVVKVEKIFNLANDNMIMDGVLGCLIDDVYGGYEVLQDANMYTKGKHVAKVVMFRSPHYCFFGNPKGDFAISDYYVTVDYESMFADQFHMYNEEKKRREEERKRKEEERRAKLEAEQRPLIEEWKDKLITISAALEPEEEIQVAVSNLKKMLRLKFPGTKFSVASKLRKYDYSIGYTDGPTYDEVEWVYMLFDPEESINGLTPWEQTFGHVSILTCNRSISAVTKAKILEQLSQIIPAFATAEIDDEVEVNDVDWMLMHLLVGVNVNAEHADVCFPHVDREGKHKVTVREAIRYIFDHTSYVKPRKTSRKKAVKAA